MVRKWRQRLAQIGSAALNTTKAERSTIMLSCRALREITSRAYYMYKPVYKFVYRIVFEPFFLTLILPRLKKTWPETGTFLLTHMHLFGTKFTKINNVVEAWQRWKTYGVWQTFILNAFQPQPLTNFLESWVKIWLGCGNVEIVPWFRD